ncbi:MAG: M20/M25/M40 family metallo-hydrolase, partial [Roseiflexaceae bacterium]
GVMCEVTPYEDSPPLSFAPWYTAIVADAVAPWTPTVVHVPSGAGHDGSMIGVIAPVAMIFVRTKDGRSHCPEEFAAHADIVAGVNAMLHTVCALDAVLA